MNKYISLTIISSILIAGLFFLNRQFFSQNIAPDVKLLSIIDTEDLSNPNITNSIQDEELEMLTESDLSQGCPRRDCIPSLDEPNFDSLEDANQWLADDDLVFGIEINGEARAYPQRILNWHEIVNDTIGGQDIAVTFCPLCGSAVSFERRVDGEVTTFGVSGKLYNSNLVMYDRQTESYWQQETGIAIIGEAAERKEELVRIPMASSFWRDWRELYPQTQVLSRDTGFNRDYDRYPYGTYEEDGELYFGIENTDTRLPLKAPGFGFSVGNAHKFYQTKDLPEGVLIEDVIGGEPVIIRNQKGIITLSAKSGEELVPIRTFWFAFAAFHPNTEVYNSN